MIQCRNCGQLISDQVENCPYCGAVVSNRDSIPKIVRKPRTAFCPFCMGEGTETDQVCHYCGKPMRIQNIPGRLPVMYPLQNGMNTYLIGTAIGQGGFGITYIARDLSLNKKVAVKEYFPSKYAMRTGPQAAQVSVDISHTNSYIHGRENFVKEARSLARFSDEPNIVHVKEVFYANNTAYIIMEFLEGITLKDYIAGSGPLSYTSAVNLIEPVLNALSQIHAAGYIHRDVSPDNIMLLANGNVKLLDFGAAKEYLTKGPSGTTASTGNPVYTVVLKYGFAPIEQYKSNGVQGPWTDIYAIAATIYYMITGKKPINAIDRLSGDLLELPCNMGSQITPDQQMVLMKGMAVLPQARYQTAAEFLYALKGVRGQEAVQSKAVAGTKDASPGKGSEKPFGDGNMKKVRNKKAMRHAVILLVVLLIAVAAVSFPKWKNRVFNAAKGQEEDFRDHRIIWHDTAVEKAVREAVGKEQGTVMLSDVIGLKRLDLSALDIEDIQDLAEFSRLEYLDLSLTNVTDLAPAASLKNLRVLWCQYCGLEDLSALEGMEKLTELHLDHNRIRSIRVLGTIPSLKEVTLSGNSISDISVLKLLPEKCKVDLTGNPVQNIEALDDGRLVLTY